MISLLALTREINIANLRFSSTAKYVSWMAKSGASRRSRTVSTSSYDSIPEEDEYCAKTKPRRNESFSRSRSYTSLEKASSSETKKTRKISAPSSMFLGRRDTSETGGATIEMKLPKCSLFFQKDSDEYAKETFEERPESSDSQEGQQSFSIKVIEEGKYIGTSQFTI